MVEDKRGTGGRFVKRASGFTGNLEAASEPIAGEPSTNINGATVVDPKTVGSGSAESGNGNSEPEGKRPRGRPPGYSPGKTKSETPLHIDGVSAILLSVHAMLAGMSKTPELMLTEDESKKMAKAAAEVAKHYNFNATEKQMAWFNLTLCCGGIYGSKFFAYTSRVKDENKVKAAKKNGAAPSNENAASATMFPDLTPMNA